MYIQFNTQNRRQITEANANFYATPFKHPARTMDAHDFVYMIDGEWGFLQDDREYTLKNDSLLILSANHRHSGTTFCRPNTRTMYFHTTAPIGDITSPSAEGMENCLRTLTDVSQNLNIKKIFWNVVNAKLAGSEEKASIFFDLLICEMLEYVWQKNDTSAVDKVKDIIHKNPERFFSNRELAEQIGISLKGLESKFKAQFGITIHQYMLTFKIQQAQMDLINFRDMSIQELANNLGFYDEYHFSNQFKRIVGKSPRQYRREHTTVK